MSVKNMSEAKIRVHEHLQDTAHLLIRALEAVHGVEVSITLDRAEYSAASMGALERGLDQVKWIAKDLAIIKREWRKIIKNRDRKVKP